MNISRRAEDIHRHSQLAMGSTQSQPLSRPRFSCLKFSQILLVLGVFFLAFTGQSVSLGLDTFLSPLTGSLGLGTFGIHFFLEDSLTLLLGLRLVNMFDQGTLVLEGVTLAQLIQLMVKVFVNLASSTVLDKKTAENPQTSHPKNLTRHSRIRCTLSLTEASVSANSSCGVQLPSTGSRVHGHRLADDESIADQFSDRLAGVCVGDFVDFVGIEPDLALSATDDRGRQALLGGEVDHLDCLLVVGGWS